MGIMAGRGSGGSEIRRVFVCETLYQRIRCHRQHTTPMTCENQWAARQGEAADERPQ